MVASVAEHRLQGTWASAAAEQGHSCSTACRVSPGQGQYWCSLHCKAHSQPLDPQRNPTTASFYLFPQENKLPSQHSSHKLISSTCFSVFYKVLWLHPELVPRKLLTCNFWRTLKYQSSGFRDISMRHWVPQCTGFRFQHQGLESSLFLGLSWGSSDRMESKHTTQQEARHKSQTLLMQVVTLGRYSKHHW